MSCEAHKNIYNSIPDEVKNLIEKHTPEINKLIDSIGYEASKELFKVMDKEGIITDVGNNDKSNKMISVSSAASFLYIVGWIAVQKSMSSQTDELMLHTCTAGMNDGNAFHCVNNTPDKNQRIH